MRFAGNKDISAFLGTKPSYDQMGAEATNAAARENMRSFANNAKVGSAGIQAQAEVEAAGHYAEVAAAKAAGAEQEAMAGVASSGIGMIGGLFS